MDARIGALLIGFNLAWLLIAVYLEARKPD